MLIAGFAVTLCLGTLYAWSVLVQPLETEFGWTRAEVTLPFMVATLSFAFGMVFTGLWQDKVGPRIVALASAILAGGGYILSSFIGTLPHLVITYGLIFGLGNSAGYIAAVSAGLKWFPNRRGLASGIVVGGYGLGAFAFAPIMSYMIDAASWRSTFMILGGLFLAVIGVASLALKNPPSEPEATQRPSAADVPSSGVAKDLSPREMLRKPLFYVSWVVFFLSCTAGLMVVAHLKPFAMAVAGITAIEAAVAVSILSVFNFTSRIGMGWLSDRTGRMLMLTIVAVLTALNMLLFPLYNTLIVLYIGAAITGMCFGTNLGLFPAITADNWGTKRLGVNYGIMLTAWGIGGVVGPMIGGYMFDMTGKYDYAFLTGAILAISTLIFIYVATRKRFGYRDSGRKSPNTPIRKEDHKH